MATVKVTVVLVFSIGILIGWSIAGVRKSSLGHRSFFSNNAFNDSSIHNNYSILGSLGAHGYFAFPSQNGANTIISTTGRGTLESVGNNTNGTSGFGQVPEGILTVQVPNNTQSYFVTGNLGNSSLGAPQTNLGQQAPASIVMVPPNNDSSGHPFLVKPQFVISLPQNLTNTVFINATTAHPLQTNNAGFTVDETTTNFLQQIGNGIKFVQDVAQNISTSTNTNFAHWVSNSIQNGGGKSNSSHNAFNFGWHWPGGNVTAASFSWSFGIPVEGSIEIRAKNNTVRGRVPKRTVGEDEAKIKDAVKPKVVDEKYEIRPEIKNQNEHQLAKKKFINGHNKQRRAHEEEKSEKRV